MKANEMIYWLALNDKRTLIPHTLLDIIIARAGTLEKFWHLSRNEIMNIGLSNKDTDNFITYTNNINLDEYKDQLLYIRNNNIRIIRYIDKEYPKILKLSGTATLEPPVLLFKKGQKIDFFKSVAIVGSRKATEVAKTKAREFAKKLAEKNYWIISGLAFGIDAEAHSGALEVKHGKTIAVLPWMTPITPKAHIDLSKRIIKKGCLVSEKLRRPPRGAHKGYIRYPYIERNRITSGLSNFLIAVETGTAGGTIRQVDLARAQNKDVYVFYPSVNSPPDFIDGFNLLIKKDAKPFRNIFDINLEKYKQVKEKTRKIDANTHRLTFGYNEEDAVNRFIRVFNVEIYKNNVKVIPLSHETDDKKLKYYLIFSPDLKERKPSCPRCGSAHVESRGHTWHCLTCNKYFKKEIIEQYQHL